MTKLDPMRLGQHVAEREDAALAADDAGRESTRRFLADYAARPGAPGVGAAARGSAGRRGSPARPFTPAAPGLRLALRLGLAAVVAAVALLALKDVLFAPAPLTFTIGGAGERGVLRDWASAPDDAVLPIRFSDGTQVELAPRARARVIAVSERGAEIVIESGRARLDVVPARPAPGGDSPWRVSLGPFSVEVKGTRFDVGWDPRTDDFSLDLLEGSVRVSGCQAGHAHTLVAGQGVRASCSQKRWSLIAVSAANAAASDTSDADARDAEVASPPDPATSLRPEDDARQPAPAETRAAAPRSGARATEPRSWQSLAARGHYAAAFERALAAGFDAECERVGASDLVLLGDTARLSGDAARARAAYQAARRRFDGSRGAAQAAFGLGRLSVQADPAEAIEWFERSLREAPRGPLAAAAHDWIFELVGETGSAARRRQVAERYLEHHPDGAHADDARRLIEDDGR